jgi:predicted DNA-binding transcriptional regulator YafY
MQIARLVETIYILMRRKTVTAATLASHFEVSTRTIYRDIDVLSLSGIPVFTEKGKGGGISLLPGFVLDKSLLNDKEQHEILTALQSLAGVHAAENERVLTKLSAMFNKKMVNWLEVDFSDWSCGSADVFDDLKTAIFDKRVVAFDYYGTHGEMTKRRVEPLQLWFKHRAWYLRAFCLTRIEQRLFKLTRIQNLSVTDEAFKERGMLITAPPDRTDDTSSIQTADGDEVKTRRYIPDVTLTLKIAAGMAYRVLDEFAMSIVRREADGSFIVNVTWPEDDWVYGTILSYGEHIEVLEPERIRNIIRQKAIGISKLYAPQNY